MVWGITRHAVRHSPPTCRALGIHCRRFAYLVALTKAEYREGLDGEKTPISDEDRERAKAQLKVLTKARKEKDEKNKEEAEKKAQP